MKKEKQKFPLSFDKLAYVFFPVFLSLRPVRPDSNLLQKNREVINVFAYRGGKDKSFWSKYLPFKSYFRCLGLDRDGDLKTKSFRNRNLNQ